MLRACRHVPVLAPSWDAFSSSSAVRVSWQCHFPTRSLSRCWLPGLQGSSVPGSQGARPQECAREHSPPGITGNITLYLWAGAAGRGFKITNWNTNTRGERSPSWRKEDMVFRNPHHSLKYFLLLWLTLRNGLVGPKWPNSLQLRMEVMVPEQAEVSQLARIEPAHQHLLHVHLHPREISPPDARLYVCVFCSEILNQGVPWQCCSAVLVPPGILFPCTF